MAKDKFKRIPPLRSVSSGKIAGRCDNKRRRKRLIHSMQERELAECLFLLLKASLKQTITARMGEGTSVK